MHPQFLLLYNSCRIFRRLILWTCMTSSTADQRFADKCYQKWQMLQAEHSLVLSYSDCLWNFTNTYSCECRLMSLWFFYFFILVAYMEEVNMHKIHIPHNPSLLPSAQLQSDVSASIRAVFPPSSAISSFFHA